MTPPRRRPFGLSRLDKDARRQQKTQPVPEPPVENDAMVTAFPPLLRVPAEIRREIYKYLLPCPDKRVRLYADCESTIVSTKWNRIKTPRADTHALAVLRTNHQIYYEALSLLYSENLFHFVSFNYLPILDFVRQLSPDAKALVRRVRITLLPDYQDRFTKHHDLFCTVIHDFLPGLTTLRADPWVWI